MKKSKFYATFGTSETYPFKGGWVEIIADDYKQAVAIYRAVYPDNTPGIVNCADIYTEKYFMESEMSTKGNLGHKCWQTLELKITEGDDTKEVLEILEEAYMSGRETGHPLCWEDWVYIEETLEGLSYDKDIVEQAFNELCNM